MKAEVGRDDKPVVGIWAEANDRLLTDTTVRAESCKAARRVVTQVGGSS